MKTKNLIVLSFFLINIFLFSACTKETETIIGPDDLLASSEESVDTSPEPLMTHEVEICVSITGQVVNPGVYYLSKDSRVYELINAAGGLLDSANSQNINFAASLADGSQLYIPALPADDQNLQGESSTGTQSGDYSTTDGIYTNSPNGCDGIYTNSPSGSYGNNSSRLVNINQANLAELTSLPSIGKTRAQAIIDYREKNPFKSIDDIKNVSGIKEATFDKIKDLICIN